MSEIPQSSALAEANPDSLAELFSRDPEGLSRQDRDRIVEALRTQRARVAQAEASGGGKKAAGAGASKSPLLAKATRSVDDMGL